MSAMGYDELDTLGGELLPQRTMLSLVTIGNTSTSYTYQFPQGGGDGDGTSQVVFACQSERTQGTPGLLGTLGLGSSTPGSSMTCVPAVVTNG